MQRLGLYITDAEAVNAILTQHPLTSNIKSHTFGWPKSSFPDVFKDRLGQCTMTKAMEGIEGMGINYKGRQG
jgi:hypothetical protein